MAPKNSSTDENLIAKISASLKTELSSYIAKALVAAVVGIGLSAITGFWILIKTQLPSIVGSVPSGAVMAFDLSNGCPNGWSPFERSVSRMLIGASNLHVASAQSFDRNGQPLSVRPYQTDGGEERHILTLEQLPAHDHGFEIIAANGYLKSSGQDGQTGVGSPATLFVGRDAQRIHNPTWTLRYTESAGGGKALDLMPPFLALPFCKKD